MSKELGISLKSVVGGIVNEELIDHSGQTRFIISFKTNAYEEGQVIWLSRNFESWQREMLKVYDVLTTNLISIKKASKKGKEGNISVGIAVKGAISAKAIGNTLFMGNLISAVRKTLAEIVLNHFSPNFDFKNPLFDALHLHGYTFTPCCSDWTTGRKKLEGLIENPFDLERLISECGAILKYPKVTMVEGMKKISITLRWRQSAMESQRETLKKVIHAFFRGMGFEAMDFEVIE